MRPAPTHRRRFAGLLAAAALLVGTAVSAQSSKDQVSWVDKSGRAKSWSGIVTENSLSQTVVQVGERERKVDNASVRAVHFGSVPPAFEEGEAYFDRHDFKAAATRFQVASTDAGASDAVKAAARFRAGAAWMQASATAEDAFTQAADQFERLLADFPADRAAPRASLYLGRAKWLAGDAKASAAILKALFQDRQKEGYQPTIAFRAGVLGAQAFVAAGDVKAGKSLFAEVQPALASHLASLDSADSSRFELSHIEADALLGEGFCLLADGKAPQAKSFFSSKLSPSSKASALTYGARLGLAEALLAAGETRAAQVEFSTVSALDYTSDDRVARAMLGLAECALKLPDTTSRQDAKLWLQSIQDQFGDTPSVLRARELAKSL